MSTDACPVCGFVWADVRDDELRARIADGARTLADLVLGAGETITVRPRPDRWTALEYAAHVRDVMLLVRDRTVLALVEDDPSFTMLHPDARVDLGLYAQDTPDVVAAELVMAAALFCRTIGVLDGEQLGRPCQYVWPEPATRSIRWMCQQVVHEIEHHLDDVRSGIGDTLRP